MHERKRALTHSEYGEATEKGRRRKKVPVKKKRIKLLNLYSKH